MILLQASYTTVGHETVNVSCRACLFTHRFIDSSIFLFISISNSVTTWRPMSRQLCKTAVFAPQAEVSDLIHKTPQGGGRGILPFLAAPRWTEWRHARGFQPFFHGRVLSHRRQDSVLKRFRGHFLPSRCCCETEKSVSRSQRHTIRTKTIDRELCAAGKATNESATLICRHVNKPVLSGLWVVRVDLVWCCCV